MSEQLGQLSIDSSTVGEKLVLAMSGSADMRDSSGLAELLLKHDAEARRLGLKQVDVDVRTVEFMNSSALNAFVRWFADMKRRGQAYRVRFLSDPSKRWQRGSLSALASFAADTVTVEAVV
ncbi:MAG: STAS domain-containing protein [Archangiaceae bacterium]|nr:STAS domain-containing protein [Archangiaceae bacterium]